MQRLLLLPLLFILFSCEEDKNSNFSDESIYIAKNAYLEVIDSIKYDYTNNEYIGRIAYVKSWKDYFLFIDVIKKQVAIFDSNFFFIKSVGRLGRGPGEFTTIPMMISGTDTLVLYDTRSKNLFRYNKDFEYIKSQPLPPHLIYQFTQPALKFNNSYIFSVTFPESISEMEYFTNHEPLVILDNKFKYSRSFWEWDDIYLQDSLFSYASSNVITLLTKGPQNSFFATQSGSKYIYQFDSNYQIIKKFGRRPLFFRNPPQNISVAKIQKSYDSFLNYILKTTRVESIEFDSNNKLFFKAYYNANKAAYQNHNSYEGERYLQIYNSDFNVIFDGKINGIFMFVKNGIIYLLEKETPNYFMVKKYILRYD